MADLKPFNYYDLIEAFREGGCAVCRMVDRDARRFLDSLLYEYVNTPDTHAAMRAGRGLCAEHSGQLVEYGASVLGIAILHAAVLDELLKVTAAAPVKGGWGRRGGGAALADKLEPVGVCMACQSLQRSENQHTGALARHIEEPALLQAYRASEGLCLPHFRAVLRAAPDAGRADSLVTIQTDMWRKLKAELDTFADKYDSNHAENVMGAEGDSWRRATRLVAGLRSVFGLRR